MFNRPGNDSVHLLIIQEWICLPFEAWAHHSVLATKPTDVVIPMRTEHCESLSRARLTICKDRCIIPTKHVFNSTFNLFVIFEIKKLTFHKVKHFMLTGSLMKHSVVRRLYVVLAIRDPNCLQSRILAFGIIGDLILVSFMAEQWSYSDAYFNVFIVLFVLTNKRSLTILVQVWADSLRAWHVVSWLREPNT